MTKDNLHITARSVMKDTKVDLFFKSIEEAAFHNPGLTDFEVKGFDKSKK